MKIRKCALGFMGWLCAMGVGCGQQHEGFVFDPERYVCLKTSEALTMDGKLDEEAWKQAAWSGEFVDIEGDIRLAPYYGTRFKMLWNEENLYIGAVLEEEHLWATYTDHDAVIFHENDFEVFMDPDGDTHAYMELEINALGTVWDLLLTKPYRDRGLAINGWEILGLQTGIDLQGTLNEPNDTDRGWSVELALPWRSITENLKHRVPENGDVWRMNFSRVQWRIEERNGEYVKVEDPATGRPFPEYNWVWSAQGVIAMHQPETWGYVQFRDGGPDASFEWGAQEEMLEEKKWLLRRIWYAERDFFKRDGRYTADLSELGWEPVEGISIHTTPHYFEVYYENSDVKVFIAKDGKVYGE